MLRDHEITFIGVFIGIAGSTFAIYGPHEVAGYTILFVYPIYAIYAGCVSRSPKIGAIGGFIPMLTHVVVIIGYLFVRAISEFNLGLIPSIIFHGVFGLIIFGGLSVFSGYVSGRYCPKELFSKSEKEKISIIKKLDQLKVKIIGCGQVMKYSNFDPIKKYVVGLFAGFLYGLLSALISSIFLRSSGIITFLTTCWNPFQQTELKACS